MSTVTKLPVTGMEPTREDKILRGMDGFINTVTGQGTSASKFYHTQFQKGQDLGDDLLEALYTDHDIAAAIVDRIVHDALRGGYELNWPGATDQQRKGAVDWGESTYGVTEETRQARIYSRLYGGGGVFMGLDGALASPAFPGAPVSHLRAFAERDLQGETFYANPAAQNYGKVELYRLRQLVFNDAINIEPFVPVHESRIIPFYGIRISDQQTIQDKGWGKSVLRRVYDLLSKFDEAFESVLHTLAESSIPVYQVESLLDLLASENGELLAKRFELINTAKGTYRAVILDMKEDFKRVEASLSQASNVVDAAMLRVSSASGQPATILWGMQPAGQNATGASDLENWNQQVASEQSLVLGPAIAAIYQRLLAQAGSPVSSAPEEIEVTFPSVETPSIQDKANLYQQIANADAIYESIGAVTAAEIAIKRSQSELFPEVDVAHMRKLDEMAKDQLLNPPDPMAMFGEEDAPEDEDDTEADGDPASED
jgi:phage-related protein (TIGR01555 family)